MSLETIARFLIFAGIGLLLVGGGILLLSRLGITTGKLPGDLTWRWGNTTVSFPIVTSIVLSILLTLILNVIFRILNK